MQKNFWLKTGIIIVCGLAITACSSMKNKGTSAGASEGAYASGIGGAEKFGEGSGNKMCAPCSQVYYFDFDEDVVHQEDLAAINLQANYLVAHPSAKIKLAGNTDERGSREYNIALGWRRAKAIARILQQEGVAAKQIQLISYGEEKPVAFGHDEDSWHLNRRDNLSYESK